jgi:membrane-bound lytic murein transglycosylase MltF
MAKGLEDWIKKQYVEGLNGRPLLVKLIPTAATDLFASLEEGRVDLVIGDLGLYQSSVNKGRFIVSHASKLNHEVLITGPDAFPVTNLEDLSGKIVYGGRDTNFKTTLKSVNQDLKIKGKPLVKLISPVGTLDSEDLLEMVDAGLIPFVIISDWKAKLWQPVYKHMVIHDDLFTEDIGWIGYAVRSANDDLNLALSRFVESDAYGQALESSRQQEYRAHSQGLKDPLEKSAWGRFEMMRPIFDKYGSQYHLDPLFIASLGFQETLLNQNAVSKVGAIGVMQLMPATGKSLDVGDIHLLEPNIHAGADYMNQLITKYFPDAKFAGDNRALFAIASYNIGPNNVAKARDEASKRGFDPNQWFRNVEFIATEKMGYEPMTYVRNVYKYFISYELKLNKIESIQP